MLPPRKPSGKLSAAYLAGIIDGEGNLGIHFSNQGMWMSYLNVYNTHLPLLEAIQSTTGAGKVRARSRRGPRDKQCHTWYVYGSSIIPVLETILPYLMIKKPQALLVLEFLRSCSPGMGRRLSLEQETRRRAILDECRVLNARGAVIDG